MSNFFGDFFYVKKISEILGSNVHKKNVIFLYNKKIRCNIFTAPYIINVVINYCNFLLISFMV